MTVCQEVFFLIYTFEAVICLPPLHSIQEEMMRKIKRGEIYYADLSPVVGSEQGGIRPVIILQNDTGNCHSPTTIVVAVTSKTTKNYLPTHIKVYSPMLRKNSGAMLEQIRTIDKQRLLEYMGKIDENTMNRIDRAIEISMGIRK